MNWRGVHEEREEHEEQEGKSQEEHSRTCPITHPLDSRSHKIHKGTRTTKGKIQGKVHPKSKGDEVLMI